MLLNIFYIIIGVASILLCEHLVRNKKRIEYKNSLRELRLFIQNSKDEFQKTKQILDPIPVQTNKYEVVLPPESDVLERLKEIRSKKTFSNVVEGEAPVYLGSSFMIAQVISSIIQSRSDKDTFPRVFALILKDDKLCRLWGR